jgi:hypothetical protein
VEVARDLFLQLFVQAAFEFAHLAATQTRYMDVIPWPVRFVVVPVAAQMQQIQFVNQTLLFKKINRAVNGNEVYASIDFLCPREDLIHVQMLFGIIHHLQDNAALTGHADATGSHRLLKFTSCLGSIEALTSRNPVGG